MAVRPRRNEKQRLCKILGGKEGALWEMCKWRMGIACNVVSVTSPIKEGYEKSLNKRYNSFDKMKMHQLILKK